MGEPAGERRAKGVKGRRTPRKTPTAVLFLRRGSTLSLANVVSTPSHPSTMPPPLICFPELSREPRENTPVSGMGSSEGILYCQNSSTVAPPAMARLSHSCWSVTFVP